jgi:hypothetical protein
MSQLKNDKGFTPANPYSWGFASVSDVESWGRLHAQQRAAVGALLEPAASMSGVQEVVAWYGDSERFDDLSNVGLGFELLADFGVSSNAAIVDQTVASALNSERYLAQLRSYLGSDVDTGGTVAGSENEDTPTEGESDSEPMRVGKAWVWGVALGALAVLFARR